MSNRGVADNFVKIAPDTRQCEMFAAPSEQRLYRIAVCGSRDLKHTDYIYAALDEVVKERRLVAIATGEQRGVDQIARLWAVDRKQKLYPAFIANWDRWGKAAGPRRNGELLATFKPDLLVAFWSDGPGTKDMISQARAKGIPVLMAGGSPDDLKRFNAAQNGSTRDEKND